MCLAPWWPMRARYWLTQWVWPVGTMGANDLRLCGDGPVSVSRSAPSRQHLTVILQSKCKCPSFCYNCKVSPRFEGQSFYWGQFDNDKETWDLRSAGANYTVFFPSHGSWLTSDIMRCAGDHWPWHLTNALTIPGQSKRGECGDPESSLPSVDSPSQSHISVNSKSSGHLGSLRWSNTQTYY